MRYNDDKDYRRWIHTARWVRLRRQALRLHPTCIQCERDGYITEACEVHHVVPVDSVPGKAEQERLMFDPANLMPLCHACHCKIHQAAGKNTKAESRRRTAEEVRYLIKNFYD